MNKVTEKKSFEKKLVWCLCVLLLTEFVFLAVCNLFFQKERMDCDSAKLYVHAVEMWKNRTYIIPHWSYITTLELDCPAVLAVPLFGLTGNIYVAFGISNMVFALLAIWVLFELFRGKSAVYPLLGSIFILLPYRSGQLDYYNMMFFNGGQYIMKVMLPLMLAALLVRNKEGRPEKREILLAVLYGLFTFLSSCSSGVYVFACSLFPVLAGFMCYKLFSDRKFAVRYWIYGAATLVLVGGGMVVNALLGENTKGIQMNLVSIEEFESNLVAALLGIFELFGGIAYEGVSVLSGHGINILIRMGFVLALLYCVIRAVKKFLDKKGNALNDMLAAVFAWNLLILAICDTRYGFPTYEYRYHLIGMIPAMCLAAVWLGNLLLEKKGFFRIILSSGGVALLLFLDVTSVKNFFQYKNPVVDQLEEICQYTGGEDMEEIYVLGDSAAAELMRLIDYDGPVYLLLRNFDGGVMAYDYYEKYVDGQGQMEGAIIVVRNDGGNWEDIQEMGQYQYRRIMCLQDYSVYEYEGPVSRVD